LELRQFGLDYQCDLYVPTVFVFYVCCNLISFALLQ
jgi:hypothetical protein